MIGKLITEALNEARDIDCEISRVEVLTAIVEPLPEEQQRPVLEEALVIAKTIVDEDDRAISMGYDIAPLLKEKITLKIFCLFLRCLFKLLAEIQPYLIHVGGRKLLEDVAQAVIDVGETWP